MAYDFRLLPKVFSVYQLTPNRQVTTYTEEKNLIGHVLRINEEGRALLIFYLIKNKSSNLPEEITITWVEA